jgi:hypothetical protein
MNLLEFQQIAESNDWDIVVWDKYKAYKIYNRAVDKSYFNVEELGGYGIKAITQDNCGEFEVRFSGEMQAAFHFIRKAIMEELSYKLGNSL